MFRFLTGQKVPNSSRSRSCICGSYRVRSKRLRVCRGRAYPAEHARRRFDRRPAWTSGRMAARPAWACCKIGRICGPAVRARCRSRLTMVARHAARSRGGHQSAINFWTWRPGFADRVYPMISTRRVTLPQPIAMRPGGIAPNAVLARCIVRVSTRTHSAQCASGGSAIRSRRGVDPKLATVRNPARLATSNTCRFAD